MANLIPPSIMAVVYGATGNVSIGGLFLAGVVPGVLIGIGLMIYSYFFGPAGDHEAARDAERGVVAARGSALPLVIPVIIMGGILTGWFTPTEAGMVAAVYILVVLIPVLRPRPHPRAAARLHVHRPALFAAAGGGRRRLGVRLDAGLPARPRHRRRLHPAPTPAPTPRMIMLLLVLLFIIVGDFIDAVPAIIIFMPIINKLAEVGNINPVHMGVVIITTLVFGLITPPYGLSLLVASKFVGVRVLQGDVRSLPLYVVFLLTIAFTRAVPRRRAVAAEAAAARIGRLLQEPERRRLHLPAIGH